MEQVVVETKFSEIDGLLLEVRKVIDRDLGLIANDIKEINDSFLILFEEYKQIYDAASSDFADALKKLSEGSYIEAGIKGVKALLKSGVAWWKKRQWFEKFELQRQRFYSVRLQIVEQKLANLEDISKNHVPFLKENLIKVLREVGSFDLSYVSREDIRNYAVDKAEEAILLMVKTYFIEGAVEFMRSVYEDILAGRVIAGDSTKWVAKINEGLEYVKSLSSLLQLPSNSAVLFAVERNRMLRGGE